MLLGINLDLWIITLYLLGIMIAGVLAGKQVTNISQFAVAGKNFSNMTFIATIFATFIGGIATSGIVSKIHQSGPLIILMMVSPVIQRIIIAYWLAPNVSKFNYAISAGDITSKYYDKFGQIVTGIILIFAAIGAVAAQISILADTFYYFFGLAKIYGAIIGAGTLILYSTLGGVKAVTMTDLIQFFILIIAIPAVCNLTIIKVGGYNNLFNEVPSFYYNITDNLDYLLKYVLPLTLAYSVPFHPVMTQRLLIAKDAKQIKYSMLSNIPIQLFFVATITIIGLASIVLFPQITSETVFLHTIDVVMPVGLKGIAIAGYLAVIMSTADSYLNAISISLINDIFDPIYSGKGAKNNKLELFLMKLTTIIVGISGIVISMKFQNVLDIILKFESIWYSTILFPMLFSFFDIKISSNKFKYFIAATSIVYFLIEFHFKQFIDVGSIVICMPFSLLLYTIFYIKDNKVTPGQIKKVVLNNLAAIIAILAVPFKYIATKLTYLKNLSPKIILVKIAEASYNRVSEYGGQYYAFSAFAVVNYLLPYFLWSPELPMEFYSHAVFMRVFAGVACIPLILHLDWPKRYQRFLPLYWHLVLMYSLPLLTTCFLLLHGASFIWFFNLSMSLMFLLILVDWRSFFVIAPSGIILGCITYISFGGNIHYINFDRIPAPEYLKHEIVYMFIFMLTIVGVFARNKQEAEKKLLQTKNLQLEEALAVKQRFLNNLNHELRLPMQSIGPMVEILDKHKKDINNQLAVKALDQLVEGVKRMENIAYDILDLASYYGGRISHKPKHSKIAGIGYYTAKYYANTNIILEKSLQYNLRKKINFSYSLPESEINTNMNESSQKLFSPGKRADTTISTETNKITNLSEIYSNLLSSFPTDESLENKLVSTEDYKGGMKIDKIIKETSEEIKTLYKNNTTAGPEIYIDNKLTVTSKFYGNINELKRAIRHVIENSIKYNSGNIKQIYISLDKTSNQSGCLITIKDNGIGIPKNEIDTIFEPFRESSFTAQKSGGKGIGLSLAKEIIKLEGGDIWAENNKNEPGCSFYIYLRI